MKGVKVEIETDQNLVEEVLNELFFKWPGCEETMKIGAEQLSDEVSVRVYQMKWQRKEEWDVQIFERRDKDVAETYDL